jgi:hypothetical protein
MLSYEQYMDLGREKVYDLRHEADVARRVAGANAARAGSARRGASVLRARAALRRGLAMLIASVVAVNDDGTSA